MSKQVGQDDDVALADIIRQHRKNRNMTQADFAVLVGLSPSMVGHVEAGTRSLSVENVEQIADRLHLTTDETQRLRAARDRRSVTRSDAPRLVQYPEFADLYERVERLAARVVRLEDAARKRPRRPTASGQ